MLKKMYIFITASFMLSTLSFAAQEASPALIKGKIIEVNTQYKFAVVNLGEKDGLKVGSFLQVLHQDKEIAKLEVIKVRQSIAAAEIKELKAGQELKIEDTIIWLPKEKVAPPAKQEKKKEAKAKKVKSKQKELKAKEKVLPAKQLATTAGVNMRLEADKAIAEGEIKAPPTLVFDAANILLRDRGFIVTLANRENGLLLASKGLLLSRWEELWAGLSGAIDHELTFSIQIKGDANLAHLEISIGTGYLKKDQYRKRIIKDNSYVYKEAVDLILEIKSWTEGLARAASSAEKKTP